MIDFFLIVISFILGTIVIGKVMTYCENNGMVNAVNKRSSHKRPTVRGGGLTFPLLITPFALFYIANIEAAGLEPLNKPFLWALILGSLVIAWMGWRDDKQEQNPLMRLGIQLSVISICTYFLPHMLPFMPLWLEKVLIVLAWGWFLNLYNFMDGLDGLATCQAIFLAVVISLISADLKPIVLVLAGCGIGILRLNFPPAKIFLGDVGSTYLGFILGGMMFYTILPNPKEFLLPVLTITLVFTADATYTLFKRIFQGHKPWQAHKDHWYQRAHHKVGLSHKQVVLKSAQINVALLIIAGIGVILDHSIAAFAFALIMLSCIAIRIRYLEGQ